MLNFFNTPKEAHQWCDRKRQEGCSIGFVPTMGALHDGHRSLVAKAVSENDAICVSIFLNPLQFNSQHDFENYPSTLQEDLTILESTGCHMAFTGTLETFFPEISKINQLVPVQPLPAITGLEADFRPGHLDGVQVIVGRLFQTVGPCRAYFGEKDFQQSLLVRQIAAQMDNITVTVCPTVREPGGLALSSRNGHLSPEDRVLARTLFEALRKASDAWRSGVKDPETLEDLMRQTLSSPGIRLEYTAIRDPDHWTAETPKETLSQGRALVAAWIGGVRLIDNLDLDSFDGDSLCISGAGLIPTEPASPSDRIPVLEPTPSDRNKHGLLSSGKNEHL